MPATPPSFSSFPPSFDSFPHVEDTSAREASSASSQRRKGFREKDEDSDRKSKKRDRRDKHAKQSRASSHERAQRLKTDAYVFDDERIMAKESLTRSTEQQDTPRQTFYSDRKGDPLSVQYGGIYSREVPKYHLVGRA
jgi:hypothetical protein